MSTALTTARAPSLLMDPAAFDHMQRVGKMLALSPLFPEHLRKGNIETAIANGVLVMNMAARLNEDPLTVAQNIYFVGGRPGWSASYMIAKANQHGIFRNPIDWEISGSGDDLSVTAFADLSGTGRRVQATCDMSLAKREGWTKNPKYQSMPEQMLRYRSATFLIRVYCPEVMVGVPAISEVVDANARDITPVDDISLTEIRESAPKQAVQAEVVPAAAPRQRREPAPRTQTVYSDPPEAQREEVTARAAASDRTEPEPVSNNGDSALFQGGQANAAQARATASAGDSVDHDALQSVFDRIQNDLLDGAVPSALAEDFAREVALMQAHAPSLYASLMDEFAAAEP